MRLNKAVIKNPVKGTCLEVQCIRLCTLNAGDPGSIPGQGTRSHMPQLKSLHAASKDLVQINK